MFQNLHYAYRVNFNYISVCKIIHTIFKKAVVKSSGNDFSNTILVVKVKVEFHIND